MQTKRLFRSFVFLFILITLLISSIVASPSKAYSLSLGNLQTPNKLNLLIVVKASKNSSGLINSEFGAKTKLEIMQESIISVLEQNTLPPNTNIGIMAFGHKVERTPYEISCSAENIEMVLPFQLASENIDSTEFMEIQGMGESPITFALEEAGKILPKPSEDTLNVILLIADDIDTCNSNPADEAKILSEGQNIAIYTISFLGGASELEAIAQNASGKNFNVPGFLNTNQRASEELNKALLNAFEEILNRVSIPVLPPDTPTNIASPTDVATNTPSSIDTPKPTSEPTDIPIQPTLETTPTEPAPPIEPPPPSTGSIGIWFALAISLLGSLAIGLWYWRFRVTTKNADKLPESDDAIIPDEDEVLENFRKNLYKAYLSVGGTSPGTKKYLPLETLKQKLASKYSPEQFDELLIQARRKYPNKIWIDKNSKSQTIVKINP